MKLLLTRILAFAALASLCGIVLAGVAATRSGVLEPDKLIILSTTDVKGKVAPCG